MNVDLPFRGKARLRKVKHRSIRSLESESTLIWLIWALLPEPTYSTRSFFATDSVMLQAGFFEQKDLKDAFFQPLITDSQSLFVIETDDSATNRSKHILRVPYQYGWDPLLAHDEFVAQQSSLVVLSGGPLRLKGGGKEEKDSEKPHWDGEKGASWERFFRELKVKGCGIFASNNDDYHLWQVMMGTDQGGDAVAAPAMPAGAGLQAATRLRTKRQATTWSYLAGCVDEDSDVRKLVLELDPGDFAPAGGGNPQGVGRRAFLIFQAQGEEPFDDEYIIATITKFDNATILDQVGYCIGSVSKFARRLNKVIFLIPVADRPDEDRLAKRVLERLSREAPESIALDALRELKAQAGNQRFRNAAAARRDLTQIVTYYGGLWDGMVRAGKISVKAATTRALDSTTLTAECRPTLTAEHQAHVISMLTARVNELEMEQTSEVSGEFNLLDHSNEPGAFSTENYDDSFEHFDNENAMSVDQWNVLVAANEWWASHPEREGYEMYRAGFEALYGRFGRSASTPLHLEEICKICFGAAHKDEDCPSVRREDRTLESVMAIHMRMQRGRGSRGRGGRFSRGFGSRGKGGNNGSFTGRGFGRGAAPRTFAVPPHQNPLHPNAQLPYRPNAQLPYGGTSNANSRRVPVFGARVATDPTLTGDFMLCIGMDTEGMETEMRDKRSADDMGAHMVTPEELLSAGCPTQFGKDNVLMSAGASSSAKSARPDGVNSVKLVLYNADAHGDVKLYCHRRNWHFGGNVDVHGVMMRPGEDYDDALLRCVESELMGDARITAIVEDNIYDRPGPDHSFQMRCSGIVNTVHCFCFEVPDMHSPISDGWAAVHIMQHSNRWQYATDFYQALIVARYSLARGIRQSLQNSLQQVLDLTPRNFVSRPPNPDAIRSLEDVGRFEAALPMRVSAAAEAFSGSTAWASGLPDDVQEWIVDCGATKHCRGSTEGCAEIWPIDTTSGFRPSVVVGNGERLLITHLGNGFVDAVADENGSVERLALTRQLIVPKMGPTLFSCGSGFTNDGICTHLNNDCVLELANGARVHFTDNPNHYSFVAYIVADKEPVIHEAVNFTPLCRPFMPKGYTAEFVEDKDDTSAEALHRRFGHFSLRRIMLAQGKSTGVSLDHLKHSDNVEDCEGCRLNERRPAFSRQSKAQKGEAPKHTKFGERVDIDLVDMGIEAIPKPFTKAMIFRDAGTKYLDARFLADKLPDNVLAAGQSWEAEHKSELDKNGGLMELHMDNGGEFKNMRELCAQLAARQTFNVPETPQDNAGAERAIGIIVRQVRIVLAASGLSDRLWPYAVMYVLMCHNSLPTRAFDPPISPYQAKTGNLPNLSLIRTFGCTTYTPHSEREQKDLIKTASTREKACNLGFDRKTHGYHIYIPSNRQYTVTRGARFAEDKPFVPDELVRDDIQKKIKKVTVPDDDTELSGTHTGAAQVLAWLNGTINLAFQEQAMLIREPESQPSWWLNPKNIEEALHPDNPYREYWLKSMIAELVGKMKNGEMGFASVVPIAEALRLGKKPMKVKWVFTVKRDMTDGSIKEWKSRVVGCGYSQQAGIDYTETFAGTIRATTIRLFLSVVCKLNMELALIDAIKAFTQAEVDSLLYGEMPPGFEIPGMCLKFNMNIEGTKQGAHLWMKKLVDAFDKTGWVRSMTDPSLFTFRQDDHFMMAVVWVDDILVGYSDKGTYESFCTAFKKLIHCKFEDKVERFVGVEITRDRDARTLTIKQTQYVERLFNHHLCAENVKEWKHQTPSGTSKEEITKFMAIKPTEDPVEKELNVKRGYLSIVGGVMYAMVFTRPDIAFHTSRVASCMHSPSTAAYEAVLDILRYLFATKDLGITYGPVRTRPAGDDYDGTRIRVVSDGSFNGRGEHSPYGGGFVEFFFGAILWVARMLKFKPLSSAEQEVGAMNVMVKEGMFAMQIYTQDMQQEHDGPLELITDSQSGIDIVRNPGATKSSVHFERWLYYVRELFLRGKLQVTFQGTQLLAADDKTKVVFKSKFLYCRKKQMNLLCDIEPYKKTRLGDVQEELEMKRALRDSALRASQGF